VHGQDEIAALDFEAVDYGLEELFDGLLVRQLGGLELPE
jgi:hypothetical protein